MAVVAAGMAVVVSTVVVCMAVAFVAVDFVVMDFAARGSASAYTVADIHTTPTMVTTTGAAISFANL